MKKKYLKIKKINQKYLYDIIKNYPNISSGRKNYLSHYKRIVKNIYLTKTYAINKKSLKMPFSLIEMK